jgi:coatomer subunit beta'
MALAFNPKDLTKFASASMDKTIKIWNLKSDGKANLTLTGHKSGVNCLNYHFG